VGAMELSEQFSVTKFIGRGCYSLVYEAFHKEGADKETPYAFKRFFLQNSSAVHCAIRERHILERLALEEYQSPFLPTLYYSFTIHGAPAFLLREGNGCDMFDLLRSNGHLSEANARFYTAELISGLEHLHSLGIVHLDLKPENVLLSHSGHTFIADFDRSFDMRRNTGRPSEDDFTGTPLFMAPEIAKGEVITPRADVWSLAVLMAELVSGPIRPVAKSLAEDLRWAKEGRYTIKSLNKLTKPLQAFFSACLQRKHQLRPEIAGLKSLRFFKYVNWEDVRAYKLKPPIKPSSIEHRPASEAICKLDPSDPLLLAAAYGAEMPVTKKRLHQAIKMQGDGDAKLATESADTEELLSVGMTPEKIAELFANFEFVNPALRPPLAPEESTDLDSGIDGSASLVEGEDVVDGPGELVKGLDNVRIRARTCSAGD